MACLVQNEYFQSSRLAHGQLGDTFLSSKHLDYMAAIAEVSRP